MTFSLDVDEVMKVSRSFLHKPFYFRNTVLKGVEFFLKQVDGLLQESVAKSVAYVDLQRQYADLQDQHIKLLIEHKQLLLEKKERLENER